MVLHRNLLRAARTLRCVLPAALVLAGAGSPAAAPAAPVFAYLCGYAVGPGGRSFYLPASATLARPDVPGQPDPGISGTGPTPTPPFAASSTSRMRR